MADTYTVIGTLTDHQTVRLDEALPLESQKVRLVVEPLSSDAKPSYEEAMQKIREGQKARGHKSRTKEEIDTYLRAERESWE
ncbi:MAG: hypothetical protein QGG64_10870 [Candidatus Latescibacteria bacterium]|jgi:hypothetical protein|nr:hypothetical protein [Candidatus Latescibacterota bacterium]